MVSSKVKELQSRVQVFVKAAQDVANTSQPGTSFPGDTQSVSVPVSAPKTERPMTPAPVAKPASVIPELNLINGAIKEANRTRGEVLQETPHLFDGGTSLPEQLANKKVAYLQKVLLGLLFRHEQLAPLYKQTRNQDVQKKMVEIAGAVDDYTGVGKQLVGNDPRFANLEKVYAPDNGPAHNDGLPRPAGWETSKV